MFSLLLLPETFDILTDALLTTDVLNVFFAQIYILELFIYIYRLQFNFPRQSIHDRRSFRLFRTCFCLLENSLYFTVRDWRSSSHSPFAMLASASVAVFPVLILQLFRRDCIGCLLEGVSFKTTGNITSCDHVTVDTIS